MSEIHDLTEKEVAKLEEAASLVKKFAKYIERINSGNRFLRKNLDEAIKAGDVTNEQKCHIRCHEDAQKEFDRLVEAIRAKCKDTCNCEDEKHGSCPLYQEFVVADFMKGVANGSRIDWGFVFQLACIGRKLLMGFPLNEALEIVSQGERLVCYRR